MSRTQKRLMREAVAITFVNGSTADRSQVFDIDIPEDHVMEIHQVEFLNSVGSNPVANNMSLGLVDDSDETAWVGHTAEKTIASTIFRFDLTTSGRSTQIARDSMNVFKTQLVKNPTFVGGISNDPGANVNCYCRIWFDFVKVSKEEIIDLLRQQQY